MNIPISIEALLDGDVVERDRIEFRKSWNPRKMLRTLCAFANDYDNLGGGYVVVGMKGLDGEPRGGKHAHKENPHKEGRRKRGHDRLAKGHGRLAKAHGSAAKSWTAHPRWSVTGLSKTQVDECLKDLPHLCEKINPLYMPIAAPVTYDGKKLLLIWAPGGYERPYVVQPDADLRHGSDLQHGSDTRRDIDLRHGPDSRCFIRHGGKAVEASEAQVVELRDAETNLPFDDRVNLASCMADLRYGRMLDFLARIKSPLEREELSAGDLAAAMMVAGGPRESIQPRNVGLLFFSDDPSVFFREARIDVVSMTDPTGADMVEHSFTGPLDRQLVDALSYIKNVIIAEKVVKVPGQAEARRVSNYAYPAIEEALCNAVYHRSYQVPEPITVRVDADKIVIASCPGPDRSISDDDLREDHLVSWRYRNRRIGDFLKALHLAEGRNSGVPTMLSACRENGSEPPVFQTDSERSYLTVTFAINAAFCRAAQKPAAVEPDVATLTMIAVGGAGESQVVGDAGESQVATAAVGAGKSRTAIRPSHAVAGTRKPAHAKRTGSKTATSADAAAVQAEAAATTAPRKRRTRAELERDIVSALASDHLTQSALARALGYAGVSKAMKEAVEGLIAAGSIEYATGEESRYPRLRLANS